MEILEQHRTPDGLLNFIVVRECDDVSLGFDGYAWHTHDDILASLSGSSKEIAVRQFVDDLLNGRSIIAIARVQGQIRDVWVTDEPVPSRFKPDDETIEFRLWNGTNLG